MAMLVPDRDEIESFPQKMEAGEIALMEALLETLDDGWTVYVQPHLNGLRPDIVIFAEDGGIGIFEVKDWDLAAHRVIQVSDKEYQWQVRAKDTGKWHNEYSPLEQVDKYRQSIFKHEIPVLDIRRILDSQVHSLVQPFVYFHNHTTSEVREKIKIIKNTQEYLYNNTFGNDYLQPNKLKTFLASKPRYLRHNSKFTSMMKEIGLAERLSNALAYPKHGNTDIINLLQPLSKKQKQLLSNESGCKRVIGAAGSGKTFLLVHKAVEAAKEGKKVLLCCFNITMANYLRDLVTRLARNYDRNCHKNIEIGHFHRLFPYCDENPNGDKRNMKVSLDVILIDEGQDFERSWIEKLQQLGSSNYHLMFCEDDRQNIYGKSVENRGSIPGIKGRPNILKESYRISTQTANLANFLLEWAIQKGLLTEGLSENVSSLKSIQGNLFGRNIWFDGDYRDAINAVKEDIDKLVTDKNTARADIGILVCNVQDGWEICRILDELKLPTPQCSFESEEENKYLYSKYSNNEGKLNQEIDIIRRRYKASFWMQGGKIKVCTIHSFKGWELNNILIFFNPDDKQQQEKIPLLYTAITRSQQHLTIYNVDSSLTQFVKIAIEKSYVEKHPKM